MNRKGYKRLGGFAALFILLSGSVIGKGDPTGMLSPILVGAEEDDLLIEDDGEVTVNRSGADLEELKAAEQEARERLRMEMEEFLEDPDLVLEPASTDKLQEYLDELTREESPIGSDGELLCARYISQRMEEYGYTVSEQSFHEGFLNEDGVDAPGLNMIAERGADSENRTSDIFIISTHYDSKTKPEEGDALANDKSGAAVLLEMARILSYIDTDTDICFLFLSGEEDGRYGSANFIKAMSEEHKARVAGVLYVETVGYEPEQPYILETIDGQENPVGDLVKAAGYLAEHIIAPGTVEILEPEENARTHTLSESEEDSLSENMDSGESLEKQKNWEYVSDDEGGHKNFADAGFPAVTVCQDQAGKYRKQHEREKDGLAEEEQSPDDAAGRKDAAQIEIDMEGLQKITDILAAAVGQVMSEKTGSML